MMVRGAKVKVGMVGLLAISAFVALCTRCAVHRMAGNHGAKAYPLREPVPGLGPQELRLDAPVPNTHRILLDARALAYLKESAENSTEAFKTVRARAGEAMDARVESGYQGFEWSDAVAELSLMWHATGEARYAESAIVYLRALLDDRFKVGDAKGGKDVVQHDSGYGIRTFAAYTSLAYDWLRNAPGMDASLRKHVLERLDEWLGWYATDGYLRDHAISNYYWGYLTALSFAGLAASGESPMGDEWIRRARDELATRALPALVEDLDGGGWPEGFQYGEYTTVEIALVAHAFRTGANIDVAGKLPWLAQTVTYHAHALLPDGHSVYDGGTWGEHPAKPSAAGLSAVTIALEGIDDARVEQARWLIHRALPPLSREQCWLALLSDRPGARERSPREGAPTSLHVKGQGLTFLRSDWSPSAVWISFQAGPRLAEDHQDADQGHFELWRGSDGLLVDGGDSEGSATINHNTLLVDDGGRNMNYPPNQGVWGAKVKTARFSDDGTVAVVMGDIGEAYAPSCAEDDCKKRSVERLYRTLVYVRPSLLVTRDEIQLDSPDYDVAWAAHTTAPPTISGELGSAVVGSSRVDVRTLVPQGADVVALREPTQSGEGSHRANHPWGPMWRFEVSSPRGKSVRQFLQFITVDRSGAAPAPSHAIDGDGLRGGIGQADGRRTAVLFAASGDGGSAPLGGGADRLVIAGLTPGRRYHVTIDRSPACAVKVSATENPVDPVAPPGGYISVVPTDCEAR